jgi:phosphoserine aminotransferase
MNLLAGRSADYIVTGSWSKKAFKEAQRVGNVRCAATHREQRFSPACRQLRKSSSTRLPPTCTSAPTKPSTVSNSR